MKNYVSAVALAAVLGLAAAPSANAQPPAPAVTAPASAAQLALGVLPAKTKKTLIVTSPAFKTGGDIPFENTQYRGNIFPGLAWTKGPAGTKSYAIIMQDPDSMFRGAIILHWTMLDIPANVTKLEPAMSAPPAGASYGPNIRGPNQAYMGPHTPPGSKHHYHLQLFALDTTIAPDTAHDYAGLTAAMKDHVLASGELVGLAYADPNAPPKPVAK